MIAHGSAPADELQIADERLMTEMSKVNAHLVDLLAAANNANRMKNQFLAMLSHELRAPLSSILMQAQLLRRGNMDEAATARANEALERGAKAQVQLLEDLVDVSRMMTGDLVLTYEPTHLCATVRMAIEAIDTAAARKAIAFNVAIDESIDRVSGDPKRLLQVVSNLLENAIKFTPKGGQITVSLEAGQGFARLTVADTGIGIDPAYLPHVFNRFAQNEQTGERIHWGLGLGLEIVRHLVERHGGTIHADSAGKGKGSTFTVSLPLMNGRIS
ncbi:MAG: HAMP domain-containing sensor histidine kinase [Deltaproteobacteria bacterium]|nr:HAMP domain-containing sensor histidine kinase [Deltaproteobacteria bacterium]